MQMHIGSGHKTLVAIFPKSKDEHVSSQVAQLHRMEEELQVCFKTFKIHIIKEDYIFKGDQTTTGHVRPALWDGRTLLADDSTQFHP